MNRFHFLLFWFCLMAGLLFAVNAFAADECRQVFKPNTTSTIGEFVLDDNYMPTITAECSIIIHDPAGNLYVSSTMESSADAWYSYTFIASSTGGFYRAIMTCVSAGESPISKDKSFCVNSGGLAASILGGFSYGEIVSSLFLFLIFLGLLFAFFIWSFFGIRFRGRKKL